MSYTQLTWNDAAVAGTHYRAMLNTGLVFEETVARLITVSGQRPTEQTDRYKVSVHFTGTFKGNVFTLYDYKGDREIHIGGTAALDVVGVHAALRTALAGVVPTPYIAMEHYDEAEGLTHQFPIPSAAPTLLAQARELLIELQDVLDDYSDVIDGGDGIANVPNAAMHARERVRALLEQIDGGSK